MASEVELISTEHSSQTNLPGPQVPPFDPLLLVLQIFRGSLLEFIEKPRLPTEPDEDRDIEDGHHTGPDFAKIFFTNSGSEFRLVLRT